MANAKLLAIAVVALSVVTSGGVVASPKWDHASGWYIEMKRVAKSARIAITATSDLGRMDAEEASAKRLLGLAAGLPLSNRGRDLCSGAAKAVIDFIGAARVGNMDAGPASYESQKRRWDILSDECIAIIQTETFSR